MTHEENSYTGGEDGSDSNPDAPPRFSEALTARLSFFSAVRKLFRRYTNRGKQREEHINCRVTRAERLHIERIADLYGVSTSHLIRDLIFTCGGVTNFTVLADLLEVLLSCYARLPVSAQKIITERGRRLEWNAQNPWHEPELNPGAASQDGTSSPTRPDGSADEGGEPKPLRRIQHMLDQLRQVRTSELRLEAGIWDELTPCEQAAVQHAFNHYTRSDYAPVRLESERLSTGHPSNGHPSNGLTPDGQPSGARSSTRNGTTSRSTSPSSTSPRGGPSSGDSSAANPAATDSPSSNPSSEPPSTGQSPAGQSPAGQAPGDA